MNLPCETSEKNEKLGILTSVSFEIEIRKIKNHKIISVAIKKIKTQSLSSEDQIYIIKEVQLKISRQNIYKNRLNSILSKKF